MSLSKAMDQTVTNLKPKHLWVILYKAYALWLCQLSDHACSTGNEPLCECSIHDGAEHGGLAAYWSRHAKLVHLQLLLRVAAVTQHPESAQVSCKGTIIGANHISLSLYNRPCHYFISYFMSTCVCTEVLAQWQKLAERTVRILFSR